MKWTWLCVILIITIVKFAHSDEYNVTDAFAAKCKLYYCKFGYNYKHFFKVTSGHKSPGNKFEMHIAIKARNNGHILLSETEDPKMLDPVYEITVGAGGNTFSEIRRMRMKFGKANADSINILSPKKFTAFWIKITDDGVVMFGMEGDDVALLSYEDPMPLNIKYFSFTSWSGVEAQVLYDCPSPSNTTEDSVLVKRNLTAVERLRKDLLTDYDADARPVNNATSSLEIIFAGEVTNVKYDVTKGRLQTYGFIVMMWIDYKMKWDPGAYEGISTLKVFHKELWMPEMVAYQSLLLESISWTGVSVNVDFKGKVTRVGRFVSTTYSKPGPRLNHWPRDDHICEVQFGIWSQYYEMRILFMKKLDGQIPTPYIGQKNDIGSEWDLNEYSFDSKWRNFTPFRQLYDYTDNQETIHNTISLAMKISRQYKTHSIIFYTPLFCSMITVLSSFWMTTSPASKTCVLCLDLIFVMIFLSQIIDIMPFYMTHVPNIVCFYICILYSIVLRIAIQVFVLKVTTDPRPWPTMNHKLKRFLLSSPITTALGLPEIQTKNTYNNLVECPETEELEDCEEQYWEMLAMVIDRSMFIIYTIVFAMLMFIKY